jgi:hypothetical protein
MPFMHDRFINRHAEKLGALFVALAIIGIAAFFMWGTRIVYERDHKFSQLCSPHPGRFRNAECICDITKTVRDFGE